MALFPSRVVVVDETVRGAEAIEAPRHAVDGHRGVEHLADAVAIVGRVRHVEEHVEAVAGLHLLLEVDVIGMDPEQLEDGVGRNVLAHGRVIEARVERGALLLGAVLGGDHAGLVGDDEVAAVVARDAAEVRAGGKHADPDRLHIVGVARGGHQGDAELLAGLQIVGGKLWLERIDDGLGLTRIGTGLDDEAHQRVAAADLYGLGLGALTEIAVDLVGIIVVGIRHLVDHGDVRGERRGVGAVAGRAVGDGFQQRAGGVTAPLRHVGISEILGGLGDDLIDLIGLELDAIVLGERAAGKIGDGEIDGLRRIGGGGAVAADRRRVGIELEGIEGGKVGDVVWLGGGKPRYDANIRLDGDVFAGALVLDDGLVDDVAIGEAARRELDAIAFVGGGALAVAGDGGGAHRPHGGEARALDRAHHALAVGHVHRGIDGNADQTDADDAGDAGAGEPFQPAARALMAFAEIDGRKLALRFRRRGGGAEINAGEPATLDWNEGLARFTARK